MLMLLVDAVVLIVLLKAFNDDEISLLKAALTALLTSIGTLILVVAFVSFMGPWGLIPAVTAAAVLLGLAISAMYGIDVKRSILIAGIFIAVHVVLSLGLQAVTS
jgi:hypothetical protein